MPTGKQKYRLTKAQVLRVWTMRAGKNSNKDIAKDIGVPPYVTSDVITRGAGPQVPIPKEIRKAALATVMRKPNTVRRPHVATKKKALNGLTHLTVDYLNKCLHFEQVRAECLEQGIDVDVLDTLQEAARRAVRPQ